MKKIKVRHHLGLINFEGSLDNIITSLNTRKSTAISGGYTNLKIEFDYGYEDEAIYKLYGERYETDEEYAERVLIHRIREQREESDARQLYERLKQKFEPNT